MSETAELGLSRHSSLSRSPRRKVVSVQELASIVSRAKLSGQVVAHAHGVFDVLHLGHARHLEAARDESDMLIVTVTADAFVNKGPGRPVFPHELRAEMLASLECVDWVAINDNEDAESLISIIRPNLYVKGKEYSDEDADVSGKIRAERLAVESYGGRILFTDDIVFSSSSLINRYFEVYDPQVRDYLASLRRSGGLDRLLELIDRVKDYRVLLIGDAIIDEYEYVLPMGKSAKENIIATRSLSNEIFAGGVYAAANHVADFCRSVDVITVLGESASYEEATRASLRNNVRLLPLWRPNSPTTRKKRYVDPTYTRKLFEVYYCDDSDLPTSQGTELSSLIERIAGDYDVVIVTDFGHGMIGGSAVRSITDSARFLAINAQSNSANHGFNLITKYPRADYICVDSPEVRLALQDRNSELFDLAPRLSEACSCDRVILTHGKNGCVAFERGSSSATIVPAVITKTVIDSVGAGDAFLAVTSPLVAAGGSITDVGFIGNVAGALKVGIVGHRKSVEKPALVKGLTALLK